VYKGTVAITPSLGDYEFHGYRSSILRYLIGRQHDTIKLRQEDRPRTSLSVEIGTFSKPLAKQWGEAFGSGVFTQVGGVADGLQIAQMFIANVTDGLSAAGTLRDFLPSHTPSAALPDSPGTLAYLKDHASRDRIFVRLSCYRDGRPKYLTTGLHELTFGDLAVIVNSYAST
jgi:hypothetical protein